MGSSGWSYFFSCLRVRFSLSRIVQVITYEKADGWVMWTWKAESADDWSYQAGLQYGWIPQDPTDLKYSGICG